jgi:hypothetical protein
MDGAKPSGKDKRFFLVEHLLNVGLNTFILTFRLAPHMSSLRTHGLSSKHGLSRNFPRNGPKIVSV